MTEPPYHSRTVIHYDVLSGKGRDTVTKRPEHSPEFSEEAVEFLSKATAYFAAEQLGSQVPVP